MGTGQIGTLTRISVAGLLAGIVSAIGQSATLSHLGGISTALKLGRYQVAVAQGPAPTEQLQIFPARFVLSNFSGEAIDFDLISHCGEEEWTLFVLRDAAGDELWQSISPLLLCPLMLIEETLEHGSWIRERADVPLTIDGVPLAPGLYQLEAIVEGTPEFGAHATFEIISTD